MKVKTVLVLSLILIFTSCASLPANIENLPIIYTQNLGAPIPGYENLTTLENIENVSTDIVKGYLNNDAKVDLQIGRGGTINFGQVISTFVVTENYKGDLKAGDTITLCELYYVSKYEGKDTIFTRSNYLPSKPNEEYIFFLSKNSEAENSYTHIKDERGRYPVISSSKVARSSIENVIESYSNKELSLGENDTSLYRSLYAEVYKKYMDQ